MTVGKNWSRYEDRLERVREYIYAHLDEELNFEHLAEIACMSPWHWHRIYKGIFGETITATVKRLRMHRAAADLANTPLKIEEVAKRSGYPNVQSFTRLFKAEFGMAPAAYRLGGSHTKFEQSKPQGDEFMYNVEFRERDATRLAGVDHSGDYMEVGKAYEALFGTLFSNDQFSPEMQMIGIYYDDPDVVPTEKLRSIACVSVSDDFQMIDPLKEVSLEGGKYAVLTHQGPYADMPKAYRWFLGEWLTSSDQEVGHNPSFELYLNNPRDVPPHQLLTEIWLPLA